MQEAEESFDRLPIEYKMSGISRTKNYDKYLNEIGYFYTDRNLDYELIDETIIGKYGNSYANRRVVVASINSYLKTITNEGYLSNDVTSYAELDVEGTREYLNSLNIDTSDMEDKDVLAYKIDSHVFIKIYLYVMDVIEQIQIAIRYDV